MSGPTNHRRSSCLTRNSRKGVPDFNFPKHIPNKLGPQSRGTSASILFSRSWMMWRTHPLQAARSYIFIGREGLNYHKSFSQLLFLVSILFGFPAERSNFAFLCSSRFAARTARPHPENRTERKQADLLGPTRSRLGSNLAVLGPPNGSSLMPLCAILGPS